MRRFRYTVSVLIHQREWIEITTFDKLMTKPEALEACQDHAIELDTLAGGSGESVIRTRDGFDIAGNNIRFTITEA